MARFIIQDAEDTEFSQAENRTPPLNLEFPAKAQSKNYNGQISVCLSLRLCGSSFLAAPQPFEPTSWIFLGRQLREFAGVEPHTTTLVARIDRDLRNLRFQQLPVAARTLHRRRPGSLRVFSDLHLRAQLFNRLLVLTVKILFLQRFSPIVHSTH